MPDELHHIKFDAKARMARQEPDRSPGVFRLDPITPSALVPARFRPIKHLGRPANSASLQSEIAPSGEEDSYFDLDSKTVLSLVVPSGRKFW